MKNKDPLIILSGATAVGKTSLSIALAKKIQGEIISADSMQVYRGMDIGTAKIKPTEMQGIPHYMIDELDPSEPFHVFEFQKRTKAYIRQILDRGKIPILVGGTGFYIQAVLYDIDFSEDHEDDHYRKQLEELAATEGPEPLHVMLQQVDPISAAEIHPNNVKRVIRALEYFEETGQPISAHNQIQREKESAYQYAYFVLNRRRDVIYDRINRRVDQMLEEGLVEEVAGLLNQGLSPDAQSMQGLGYKEIVSYLQGERSLSEAKALLQQNTRHFAKRQITWFKREKDVQWLNYEDFTSEEEMLQTILEILKEKNIVSIP